MTERSLTVFGPAVSNVSMIISMRTRKLLSFLVKVVLHLAFIQNVPF